MGFGPTQNGATLMTNGRNHKTMTATAIVKTGATNVYRILVAAGTGSIDVYDGVDNTTDHIYAKTTSAVGDIYEIVCPCTIGIYVVMGAAGTITVTYE